MPYQFARLCNKLILVSVCACARSCQKTKFKNENVPQTLKQTKQHHRQLFFFCCTIQATVGCYINAVTSAVLPRRRGLAPSSSSLTKNTICLICIIHLIHAQMLSSGVPSVTMWAHNSARTATRGFALWVNIWVLSRAQISFFFLFCQKNRNVQF